MKFQWFHQTFSLTFIKGCVKYFGITDNKNPFAGKSILLCGDLYQLPPIRASPVFSFEGRDKKMISIFKLWHLFKLAELTESMRQKGDNTFIDLLNNIRIGEMEPEYEEIIESKIISASNKNYPWNALHLLQKTVLSIGIIF